MNTTEMEKGSIFLVLFTVLMQAATGFFILKELFIYTGYCSCNDKVLNISSSAATGIIILIALLTALFHLGKPLNAIYTLNNLKSSWLSREIFFVLIFSAIVFSCFLTDIFLKIKTVRLIFSLAGIIAGTGLIISMSGIYMLNSVPLWNNFSTPAGFILTAIVTGTSLLLLMKEANKTDSFLYAVLFLAILFSAINSILIFSTGNLRLYTLLVARTILSLAAIISVILIYFSIIPNKIPVRLVLLLILLSSEVAGRIIFFTNYTKGGL